MARKKTILISAGILATVLITLLVFNRTIAGFYLSPPAKFKPLSTHSQPDYRVPDGWYAHPGKDSSARLQLPAKLDDTSARTLQADVFFIHPTTYFGPGEWNSPANDQEFARQGIEHIGATVASSFSTCCDIYMPRYRQAHLNSFGEDGFSEGVQALDFAYQDVRRAFQEFLSNRQPGRPFFLAGHSQGSLHGLRLLAEEIEHSSLHDDLVAAYLIGYWLPPDIQTKTLQRTPLCSAPDQTGCMITFDSFEKTGSGKGNGFALPLWYSDGWQAKPVEQTLCVNPLSWAADGMPQTREANLGSLPYQSSFSLSGLLTNQNPGYVYTALDNLVDGVSSAKCNADGSLLVDIQDGTPFDNPGKGEEKSLHPFEWNMFYLNIRNNISGRLLAYPRVDP